MEEKKTEDKTPTQTEEKGATNEQEKEETPSAEKQVAQIEGIQQKLEHLEADRLSKKTEELLAIEKRIDEKINSFQKFVTDTETHGRAVVSRQLTGEEKSKQECEDFLKKVGLDDASIRPSERK